jgi:hypothetical protein
MSLTAKSITGKWRNTKGFSLRVYSSCVFSTPFSKATAMNATLEFNPTQYTEAVLRLILAKASEWKCTPEEALTRLLDQLAARSGFTPKKVA